MVFWLRFGVCQLQRSTENQDMNQKPPIVARYELTDLGCILEIRSAQNLIDAQIHLVAQNWMKKRDKRRSYKGKTVEVIVHSSL